MTEAENNDLVEDSDIDQLVEEQDDEAKEPLTLEVKVESPSSCQRHVTVQIAREDINRYLDQEFDELLPKAEVPGFRPGRAPRKLVVNRFKDHVYQQVKGKLLMDSLAQVSETEDFSPISEPDIDLDAIEIPDEGPMTFEFDLEVRPQFDLPEWKGLELEKPVREITGEDVDQHLHRVLRRYGHVVERSGPAELEDQLTLDLEFTRDGHTLSRAEGVRVALKPRLSLRDATIETFGELLSGAAPGDVRETEVTISPTASDELAGQTVQAGFRVTKVESVELPKLTSAFLDEIGGFVDEDDLRDAVREELERQQRYRSNQRVRQQITRELTANANWELPPALLKRQAQRELRRAVLELQSSGFSNEMIQAYANQLQQNILDYTATALKEHFILERIAEEEKIDAEDSDFDAEIELLAEQSGIPPRRVRARLEKRGEIDSLRNQIIERKVIEKITSHASVNEVPAESLVDDTAAIDYSVTGKREAAEIPEAKHGEEASDSLPT